MTKKNLIRLVVFLACGYLVIGWGLPEIAQKWTLALPRLSPILSFFGAIASRRAAGWLILLGIPLLVLAIFKNRWFCWHLCPMGFAAEMASRLNPKKGWIRAIPVLNQVLAGALLFSAVIGYPIFIWLDPLCIFNGFFAAWREPLVWINAGTAIAFVAILLLSLIVPNIWCHRLCPLGGLQALVYQLFHPAKREAATGEGRFPALNRRLFLGAAAGGVAAVGGRQLTGKKSTEAIRPPGAVKANFNGVCARCGNCMRACPYELIQPDLGMTGLDGLFTPVVRYRHLAPQQEQYCFQDCKACTEVCPTGALRPITVEQKHETPMGRAVVYRDKCVAWAKKEYCVVCQEYCPYQAVIEKPQDGVMVPVIDADKCRGCGACESACPADPIAIIIRPING
ncbi:MAG: 4Fe-4S binding protein [Kiritimatiellae bacterium]|nr:4Fe-4S binding protein [Kiritimatiellia bacterium]